MAKQRESTLPWFPRVQSIDAEHMRRNLHAFVRGAWKAVEGDDFVDGWHIRAICDHLQAVSDGRIKRLIINVPPRHTKSLLVSVFWPMWDWLSNPWRRFFSASYAFTLSVRDSRRGRMLFCSDFYQRLLSDLRRELVLVRDQNEKGRFENHKGGSRLATSVDGALTGEGGHIGIVDDPHNVVEGESEARRVNTLQWWDEAMSTRLNNPKTGAFVIIMQRVHEDDLTGHILSKEMERWDHLCLSARYEGEDRVRSTLGFCDPRTTEGQLLWPERFGDKEVDDLESSLGEYAAAGQLYQRPAPREGGMFKVKNFYVIHTLGERRMEKVVRYWDKAGTRDGGCRTAGVKMARLSDGSFVVLDVVTGQWSAGERERMIRRVAQSDGHGVEVWVEQEPGSGGKESAEATVRNLAGFTVRKERPVGDKALRAEPYAAQVDGNNVALLFGAWNERFKSEHKSFPNGKFKDQVDAAAAAFAKVCRAGGGVLAVS